MAEYRFSAKIVSRGAGQSVIAKAAYNARAALHDERTGALKDYSRGNGLEFSGIFAPEHAPEWMKDREKLWNAVELQEDGTTRRATAQLARNIELNLPHELNADQRRQLVRDFVREQFLRQGMVADVAIHAPDRHSDERNYHAHILFTLREIDGDGFSSQKARHWNSKALNLQWREKWAELGARYLEKAGFTKEAERYSYGHFTLPKQRSIALERGDLEHAEALDREATKHKGPHVAAMERRGMETERGQLDNDTLEENKLRAELREVEKAIAAEQRREKWHDRQDELKAPAQRPGIVDFALDEERVKPQTRGRDAREIYAAFDESNRPKPFRSDAFRARAFMNALDEQGIALASVTKEEAARSHREAAFARETGRYAPSYRASEIVAVTLHGSVHRLNERTTGLESAALETRLQKIDRSRLQGLDTTKATMTERAAIRRETITAERMERARTVLDFRTENTHAAVVRGLGAVTEKAVTTARKTDKLLTRTAGKALDAVANLVGGLLGFFFPDAPKTKEHIARIVDEKERTAHANGIEADRAASRASYDNRHAEVMKKHREEARQQDRHRDDGRER